MRILQLIQKKQLRGAEVFTSQLSEHLTQKGHEVKIVALLDGVATLPFSGPIEVLHAQLKKRFWDFKSWKKLAQIIDTYKPDIVQANAGETLKYAIFSKRLHKWKQPIIFRNASTVSSYSKSYLSKKLARYLFSKTDYILSVSSSTREDLVKHFNVPKEKMQVIPIGIEAKPLQKIPAFQNGCINLVHVGGFSFEKNHQGLLRIFKAVKAQHENLKLWLVGDGPLRTETEAYAEALGIADDLVFTGFVNNPLDYIYSADMLLLPSIIEGLPGVIIEAFYCKTPVIAYHVGGIGDLISHQNTGYLITAGHEEAFISSVMNLLSLSKAEKEKMTDKAYNLAVHQYLNPVIADQFLAVYKQLS